MLYPMSENRDNLSNNRQDALLITQVMKALEVKYHLAEKMAQEPGLKDIIQQFIGRIEHAFGSLAHVKGRRILDIACGSNTSKAPESFFVNTPFGERRGHFLTPQNEVNCSLTRLAPSSRSSVHDAFDYQRTGTVG